MLPFEHRQKSGSKPAVVQWLLGPSAAGRAAPGLARLNVLRPRAAGAPRDPARGTGV